MKLRLFSVIVLALAMGTAVSAQDANSAPPAQNQQPGAGGGWQGRRGGGWGGGMGQGRGVMGTVTEVAADHYTIKTETGEVYTVHFSANTHIVKAPARRRSEGGAGGDGGSPPQQIKPTDIKVGDAITAGGELDANAKSVGAVFIALIDPEQAQRMREMEANFGKTWLAGKVTAIDGVKVTLQGGPGNASHIFMADENTTFRKRREPITLADVQVGDSVRVEGSVKDGTFLATSVGVMGPPPPQSGTSPAAGPK
jgi:hypothetical protein